MKRLLLLLVLCLIVIQLCLLPNAVNAGIGFICPRVATNPATDITCSTATFNGNPLIATMTTFVTPPEGELTASLLYIGPPIVVIVTASFQYGTVSGVYTSETVPIALPTPGPFQYSVSGLSPGTTYYVRAKLTMPAGVGMPFEEHEGSMRGAGVGLDYYAQLACPTEVYGNEISFTTPVCQIGSGTHGSGGTNSMGPAAPTSLPNIVIQSATIATTKVAPGEKVDVTATATNRGGTNGTSRITLYVNGQEVESKGIILSSGETRPVQFTISRNEPGIYNVYVNNIPAGSITVDTFTNNDALIYGIIALFTLGIIGVLYLVVKRRAV